MVPTKRPINRQYEDRRAARILLRERKTSRERGETDGGGLPSVRKERRCDSAIQSRRVPHRRFGACETSKASEPLLQAVCRQGIRASSIQPRSVLSVRLGPR